MKRAYRTEIELNKRYRDKATGFEGTSTCIAFYTHGCERVTLRGFNKNSEIVEYSFDAPEVELIRANGTTRPVALVERKTGGPHSLAPMSRR